MCHMSHVKCHMSYVFVLFLFLGIMKPLLLYSIASFSNKWNNVLVEEETKLSLDNLGREGGKYWKIKKYQL